jgi:hypothetical protein
MVRSISFMQFYRGKPCFSIARAYGVTVEDIERENPELREHGLRYNQMIRIPVKKMRALSHGHRVML